MPGRLSKEETDRMLSGDFAPRQPPTPVQLAVEASRPRKRLTKEETDAALSASAAPLSTAKDIRQSTTANPDPAIHAPDDALAPTTSLGASLRGATQGGTLRFGDELGAGAMMVPEAVGRVAEKVGILPRPAAPIEGHIDQAAADAAQERDRPSIADTYRGLRDGLRADNAAASKAHPLEYGGSEAAAGLTTPIPGRGLIRGAPLAAKVGLSAAQAAGLGTVLGAGGSDAKDWRGVLKDSLVGGATAAPFGAAGGGVSHLMEGAGPYFAEKAGERAVQAAGARAGIVDRLAKEGIDTADVPALGNRMLDEGLIPSGLNLFRNPQQQTLDRALALKRSAGQAIGERTAAFDAARPLGPLPEGVDRIDFARLQSDAARPLKGISAQAERTAGPARELVEDIGAQHQITPGSMTGARELKTDANDATNFALQAKGAPVLKRKVGTALTQGLERQYGEQEGPEALAALKADNERYGLAMDASKLAKNALSRDVQKQQFGTLRGALTALAAGGGLGGAVGGPAGLGLGPLAVGANALINQRAPNIAAHANRLMSAAVPASSPAMGRLLNYFAANPSLPVEIGREIEGQPKAPQVHPRDGELSGHPGAQTPRRARGGARPAYAAGSLAGDPDVEVHPLEPLGLTRVPESGVDVQALEPTQIVWSHDSTPEEIAAAEDARKKERMMKLARYFGGHDDSLDDLQPQR